MQDEYVLPDTILEQDINYAVNETEYILHMLEDRKNALLVKLAYYCMQNSKIYFRFADDFDTGKLKYNEVIDDVRVYDIEKNKISKTIRTFSFYTDLFTNMYKENRDCLAEGIIGRAEAFDVFKHLYDKGCDVYLNNKVLLTEKDLLNILDYPVFRTSIYCKSRKDDQIADYDFTCLRFRLHENKEQEFDILKEILEKDDSGLVSVEVSKLVRNDPEGFKAIVDHFIDEMEKGYEKNIMFTVASKKLEKEANMIIDKCFEMRDE